MNKFLKVFIESRGEVGEMEVVSSELSIDKFCEELYNEMKEEFLEMCKDPYELEDMKEYLQEFGHYTSQGDCWSVCVNEEEGYEVYELK